MIIPFVFLHKRKLNPLNIFPIIFMVNNEAAAAVLHVKLFQVTIKPYKPPLVVKLMVANESIHVDVWTKSLGHLEKLEKLNDGVGSKLMQLNIIAIKYLGEVVITRETKTCIEVFSENQSFTFARRRNSFIRTRNASNPLRKKTFILVIFY